MTETLSPGLATVDHHDPVRVAELDTPDETGWLLTGGVTLLVGARHAVLIDPDGRRRTLVPDPQDPVRNRLRALASRLGLSPSAGLAGFPEVPADVAEGALWADVSYSAWWTTRDGAGSAVDPAFAAWLPDLDGPPVEPEGPLGPLLASLRAPGIAPATAVAVVPCAVIRRVDLDRGRFRYRELWQDSTGEPVVGEEAVGELVSDLHPVDPPFRPIARVAAGPVRVQVDGLHRSFLFRVGDGTRTSVFFLPGLPGATARAEEQLARLAAQAGLPPATVVVRHRRAVTESDLDPGTPADGVRVTRRTSVVNALLAATDGSPATAPLTDDPVSEELRGAVTLDDEDLRAAAETFDDGLRAATFGACLAVDEEWTSRHGSATRSYLVAPGPPLAAGLLGDRRLVGLGAPMLVTLADGSLAREHITVDSGGHLIDARRGTACPVCERLYATCCGIDVTGCATCGRAACATCRQGADVPVTRCAACGNTSCGACSRDLPVAVCALCGRDACAACTRDGHCATCRRLTPATADQIAHLPPELAAAGHLVLAGADATGVVVVLAGPHRRELALFDETGLQLWETAADDPLLPLRIAAAKLTGGGEATFAALPAETAPPAPADWLVLEYAGRTVLQWAVLAGGARRAGNFEPPGPGTEELDDILLDELAEVLGAEPGPARAAEGTALAIHDAVASADPPAAAGRVVVQLVDTENLIAVDARGLVRRRAVGSSVDEEVAAWLLPGGPVPWAYAGWNPEPEVVALAELEGWSAVIARVGGFAMLGMRQHAEEPVWHQIGGDPAEVGAGVLGALVAEHTLGVVTSADFTGPLINGGMRVAREAVRRAAATPAGDPVMTTEEALRLLGLDDRPASPEPQRGLPDGLSADLLAHLESFPPRRTGLALGARVDETWRLPDGTDLRIGYDVAPGRSEGHVADAVTGAPLRTANVCREHHLVERTDVCASCRTATCRACADPVRPCPRCGGGLCGRCAGLCPSCVPVSWGDRLRRVGWSTHRDP